ncbi:beta-galactosidase [Actinoallomurus sp. CA-150999]|uniref:beta-galactosidase n=1 Tax=Actinoallomurus sp. CA-150999 TaxID=3239887 RepID=UPI003D9114E4
MNRPRKLLAALTAVVLTAGGASAADAAVSARPKRLATSSQDAAFKGIIAFSGGHTSDLASNPDIAGRSLAYYWAQLEPKKGQYNWSVIDNDMKPWVDAGKKVVLRVSAAGWAKWDKDADSAHGTPQWVYDEGVKSVTEQDKAVFPQYWSSTFEKDYDDFIKAFAARYDGNASVAFIDAGVGVGGETKPDSEKNSKILDLWKSIGYTDKIWWGYVQNAIGTYAQAFTRTPVAVMPDKTFLGSTDGYNEQKTLDYSVAQGAWLQDNGLGADWQLKGDDWQKTTLVGEQRGSTSDTGDDLMADFQAALDHGAAYILAFTDDLENPDNAQTIHQVASEAGGGHQDRVE